MTTDYQRELTVSLIRQLFEPETRQFRRQVDRLIDDNDALVGQPTEGFNYLGTNYGRDGRTGLMNAVSLDPALMSRMLHLGKFVKQVEHEKQLITQIVFKLITPCSSVQDMRDALPECLVCFVDKWKTHLKRTREPAWTIAHNERDMRQYLQILPKIETYSAMRFLY